MLWSAERDNSGAPASNEENEALLGCCALCTLFGTVSIALVLALVERHAILLAKRWRLGTGRFQFTIAVASRGRTLGKPFAHFVDNLV